MSIIPNDYAFARKSAVPNVGEDVRASARHRCNAWRGLFEAEKDGTAAESITLANLLEHEPLDLQLDKISRTNAMSLLTAHLAIRTFPSKPEDGKWSRYDKQTTPAQRRQQFYETYQTLKGTLEKGVVAGLSYFSILDSFHKAVMGEIDRLRGQKREGGKKAGKAVATYNAVANLLCTTSNRSYIRLSCLDDPARPYRYAKNSVMGQLKEFDNRLMAAYGNLALTKDERGEKIVRHVLDVIGGQSLDRSFGKSPNKNVTLKKKGFMPADLYGSTPERKGGRDVGVVSVAAGSAFMMERLKMRAIQYGNTMPDTEREYHLKTACEAFADLADVLGLADADISGNGALAVAFGARGHGTALAHYEPTLRVINLTRKGGVGSLAHEWGHFFDNMLGALTSTQEHQSAYLIERLWSTQSPPFPLPGTLRAYHLLSEALVPFRRRVSAYLIDKPRLGNRNRNYWTSSRELFARAFERYVQKKLDDAGRLNTYLAGSKHHEVMPTAEEMVTIAPTFDAVFVAYANEKTVLARTV